MKSQLTQFVQDLADADMDNVHADVSFGIDQIYISSKGSIDRAEWIETGEEYAKAIQLKFDLSYEVATASPTSVCLMLS